jgi:arylsulfatase A-like enzyme
MNALEKLLRANRYDVRLSYDIISHQILLPSTPDEDLDEGVQNMNYRFCSTLTKLTTSLATRSDRPLFVYTMPQDVHVSTLSREGNVAVDADDYGDKFAPYASRVRRLDTCFGTFIESLKAMGLYDESVIVFTADHGDSLGEGGRWGHAYTVFPEILRVPLLIKLPRSHDGRWASRIDEVAFTTDVTPTLYRLLGYEVTSDDRFFGVPLVGAAGTLPARTPRHLAASSYGPVYAVFDDGGDSLYILDAVNYRDYLFRLGTRPGDDREVTATPEEQADYQAFIRLRLREMHALYGVKDER